MNRADYIIDKLFVDVNIGDTKTAYLIKDQICGFLQDDLLPQIELIFEKYNPEETVVRFNKLEFDLNVRNWKNQEELKFEICNRLEKKLRVEIPFAERQNGHELGEDVVRKISPEKNREDVFLFFLKNGYLPWFGNKEQIREISKNKNWRESLSSEYFFRRLQDLLGRNEKAFNRLLLQFPAKILIVLFAKTDQNFKESDQQRVLKIVNELCDAGTHFLLCLIANVILKKGKETERINQRNLIKLMSSESKLKKESAENIRKELWLLIMKFQPELTDTPNLKEWLQTGVLKEHDVVIERETGVDLDESNYFEVGIHEISVTNAGLIILHPFFTSFFEALKIIDQDKQIIAGKKELALQALHYLVAGDEDFFEGNLMIEKFICGIPLNWPAQRESLLDESIKKEVDILLEQVLTHWPALKNTSADGLRQLFLQRNGKLIQNENKFKLIVERKGQDVLLEKLYWNISLIKLPWIDELLNVEW